MPMAQYRMGLLLTASDLPGQEVSNSRPSSLAASPALSASGQAGIPSSTGFTAPLWTGPVALGSKQSSLAARAMASTSCGPTSAMVWSLAPIGQSTRPCATSSLASAMRAAA